MTMDEDGFVQLDKTTWVRPEKVDGYRQAHDDESVCHVIVSGHQWSVDISLDDLRKALHGPAKPDLGVGGVMPASVSRTGWWLVEGDAGDSEAKWQLRLYALGESGFQVAGFFKGSKGASFPAVNGEHYPLRQEGVL